MSHWRPKNSTLAIRKSWNGATNTLRTPAVQASVSAPGWRTSRQPERAVRASMLVKACSAFSAIPRSVSSCGGSGSSPHWAQYRVVTVALHIGHVQSTPSVMVAHPLPSKRKVMTRSAPRPAASVHLRPGRARMTASQTLRGSW